MFFLFLMIFFIALQTDKSLMVDYIVAFSIYNFTCKKGTGLFICLSNVKYDTEEYLSHIVYDFKITLAFFQLCEGSPCPESSLIYDDITSSWRQHYYVTDPAAVRSKVHVKQLWAWKTRLQFSGKQAGPRVRVKESGPRGEEEEKDKKANPEIWSLARAETLPSAFSYYAWGNEKKINEGETSRRAFKALLSCIAKKGSGKQGLHKREQVRSRRGNYSAYVSAVGKSLTCREYSKLVPNGLGFCHMVLIIKLKLHCHAFRVNEMDG